MTETLIYLLWYIDVSGFDMSATPHIRRSCAEQKQSFSEQLQPTSISRRLDQILLDCIDAVLTEVLGRRVREAIYDHLTRHSSLGKDEIPTHLDEFCSLLQKHFGKGAVTLEKRIVKHLYSRLGCKAVDIPNFGLADHFELVSSINERAEKVNSKTDEPSSVS
jgi:hypothetical protein